MYQKFTAALCALLMASGIVLPVQASAETSVQASLEDYTQEVVTLINQERTAQGLNPVENLSALNQAATIRSQELVKSFSHTRPDGRGCSTVLDDNGITWRTTGENIAYGYSDPVSVMDGWMHSSGHRANILNASFDAVGIGVVSQNGVLYWTQIFTGGAEASNAYQPEIKPSEPVQNITVPEQTENNSPVLPESFCIGQECFTCCGTDCTAPQNILSCLNGNCNTQDILSCLNGNCNSQDVLSCLNGNCNQLPALFQNLCK